jgi:hypothetical protein
MLIEIGISLQTLTKSTNIKLDCSRTSHAYKYKHGTALLSFSVVAKSKKLKCECKEKRKKNHKKLDVKEKVRRNSTKIGFPRENNSWLSRCQEVRMSAIGNAPLWFPGRSRTILTEDEQNTVSEIYEIV